MGAKAGSEAYTKDKGVKANENTNVDYEDYDGGCEMFVNPYDSEEAVRQAILNHNKRKETLK